MTYAPPPRADWYADPAGGSFLRYWDGTAWTAHTRPLPGSSSMALSPSPVQTGSGYAGGTGYIPRGFAPVGSWRSHTDDRPLVATMFDAVGVVFRKYAQFDGRAGRPEYWYTQLAAVIVAFLALFAVLIPFLGVLIAVVAWAGGIAVFLPLLAVTVRRLRDAELHWAWIFICFVPLGSIVLIVLLAQPSKFP